MGYETSFKIALLGNEDTSVVDEVIKALCLHTPYRHWGTSRKWSPGKITGDDCTWSHHQRDMGFISTLFPTITFEVEGAGAEQGDVWKEYYLNGKTARYEAVFTIPEYNPDDLT